MPSPNEARRVRWPLLGKEVRELVSARATLVFALALGPLVGHAFTTAVSTYSEMSGGGGGPAALAQGLSPLDGIVVPTFGAYAIAVTLLFPFVAIRLLSAEKESGALDLLVQSRFAVTRMILAKMGTLLAASLVSWLAGAVALALWLSYGGHVDGSELASVLVGHFLRAAVITAVALAAAAVSDTAATAAVIALAFTLGTWALDFIAQVKGGLAQRVAAFTPESALRTFERGELSLAVVGVSLAVIVGLTVLAGVWLHPGRRASWRWSRSAGTLAVGALCAIGLARARASWDLSEDRRNSFSPADERALRQIKEPLEVTVYLAPEDPRLVDLQREILRKLERTVRDVRVTFAARSSTGIFEKPGEHYGEVWYQIGGRKAMSRSATEPIVLELLDSLAGVPAPKHGDEGEGVYSGYPLVAKPTAASPLLYVCWPILVAFGWFALRRKNAAT